MSRREAPSGPLRFLVWPSVLWEAATFVTDNPKIIHSEVAGDTFTTSSFDNQTFLIAAGGAGALTIGRDQVEVLARALDAIRDLPIQSADVIWLNRRAT